MPELPPRRRAGGAPFHPALLALFALTLAAAPAAAQIVRGTVVDAEAGTPIAHAEVVLIDEDGNAVQTSLSDGVGAFMLQAPKAGRYTLNVRHIAFVAVSTPVVDVMDLQIVDVQIRMSTAAITLDPLVVVQRRSYGVGQIAEFYERADRYGKGGFGRIYFHEDIQRYISLRHLFMTLPRQASCGMPILIDGLPIDDMRDLDAFANPKDVEGVEVYRSWAQVPPEYQHLANQCGIALVWTRPTPGSPFSFKRLLVAVGVTLGLTLLLSQ